jgi:hypothetical protein
MTTTVLRSCAIACLAFLGATSVAGALPLLRDPSGGLLKMPLSLLEHSPFHSYLVPGILLLLGNGLLSFVVLLLTLRRVRHYAWWIMLQGSVLATWILAEFVLIRLYFWPQGIYLGLAALLLLTGGMLRGRELESRS